MPFGQLVIGPPGSGKTVYCDGMHQFLTGLGRRVCVVNLDPANGDNRLPYPCNVNIVNLISIEDVAAATDLGPNGGLIYCMEYLEKNLDWLEEQLSDYSDHYIIFDCPGQVELYSHHSSVHSIVEKLQRKNFRLAAVHLVDSYYCCNSGGSTFVSVLLLTLSTMLRLEMPHVNVLSKIDLLKQYGKLDFSLDFYTEVMDLSYLFQYLDVSTAPQFAKLNKAICNLVQDFSLVSFIPLNIQDKGSVSRLVAQIDKANGYVYGGLSQGNESIMQVVHHQRQQHGDSSQTDLLDGEKLEFDASVDYAFPAD